MVDGGDDARGGPPAGAPPGVATVYAPARAVDLDRTLRPLRHGARDPAVVVGREGAAIALNTPRGPATLVLVPRSDRIEATAWGAGAEWAIASVPDLLGAGDDDAGFDAARHPFVREAATRFDGLRLTRTNRVLVALVPAVLEQEVTATEALRGWRLLVERYGSPAPRPSGVSEAAAAGVPALTLPPTAQQWRGVPSWAFHEAGIAARRWRTIQEAALAAASLERTLRLGRGGAEISRRLRLLPGVGIWTAACTTQVAHGDPDSPAYGDAHVSRSVCWALARELLPAREADERMAQLLEPWAGHRERVVRLVLAAGVQAPRRGPRTAPPAHRSW